MEVWMQLELAGFLLVAVYGWQTFFRAGREWNQIRSGTMPRQEIADEICLKDSDWESKYRFRAAATVNPGDTSVGEKPFVENDVALDVVSIEDLRFGVPLSVHVPMTVQRDAGKWLLNSMSKLDRERLDQALLDSYFDTLNEKIWGRSPCFEAMGDLLGSRPVNN